VGLAENVFPSGSAAALQHHQSRRNRREKCRNKTEVQDQVRHRDHPLSGSSINRGNRKRGANALISQKAPRINWLSKRMTMAFG
jgi:hypothetical protein